MVFQQNLLEKTYFTAKMPGLAMVWLASTDFWKAPSDCLTLNDLTRIFIYLIQYLSRGIQFSRASLNGALTKHKNKDIKTLK